MAINIPFRQGGKCWDERERRWKRCGDASPTQSVFAHSDEQPLFCCLGSNCCLSCEELKDILLCFYNNAVAANNPLLTFADGLTLRDMVGLLHAGQILGFEPSCNKYSLRYSPGDNTAVIQRQDNSIIDCYIIDGDPINANFPVTDGQQFVSTLILTPTTPLCPIKLGISFLFEVKQAITDFNFIAQGAKICYNPEHIVDVYTYNRFCEDCQNKICTLLVGEYGIGYDTVYYVDLGEITTPVVRDFRTVIPYCCNSKLNRDNYTVISAVENYTLTLSQVLFLGTGNYLWTISIDPTGLEPGVYSLEVRTEARTCPGASRLIIRYTVP